MCTQVRFVETVKLQQVHIYETMSPGAVVKIQARDYNLDLVDLWSTGSPSFQHGGDSANPVARIFNPALQVIGRTKKFFSNRTPLTTWQKEVKLFFPR